MRERPAYRNIQDDEARATARHVLVNAQDRDFTIVSAIPANTTMDNGNIVILDAGGATTRSLIFKAGGVRYRVDGVAV